MAKSYCDITFRSQLGKILIDTYNENKWCNGFLYGIVTSTGIMFLYYYNN